MYRPKHYSYHDTFSMPIENDFEHITASFEVYAWKMMQGVHVLYTLISDDTGEVYDDGQTTFFFDDLSDIPVRLYAWIETHCPLAVTEAFKSNYLVAGGEV